MRRLETKPPTARGRLLGPAALLLAASGCGGGEPSAPRGERPNLVVIVMDTVRRDLLSAYGYERPTTSFLERFAAQSTRYDRAIATSNWTLASHASLFTGVLPRVHRADQLEKHLADSLPTLAERLAAAGYETGGFSNNAWVSERTGLARGFATFRELSEEHPGEEGDARGHPTVRAVTSWLRRGRDRSKPFFCFVNVIEPHLPYLPPWPVVADRFEAQAEFAAALGHLFPDRSGLELVRRHYLGEPPLSRREEELLRILYEGELRVVDSVVERLVGAVDAVSDPRETVVVVLSDHGENLGEHGHFTHFFNLYETNLEVPLIVRGPGFEAGRVDSRPVQVHDLYPTLLGLAGLEPGPQVTGVDLRAAPDPERIRLASVPYPAVTLGIFSPRFLPDGSPPGALKPYLTDLAAALGPRTKLIRHGDGREELYDLVADPAEAHLLQEADVPADELARLRRALDTGLGEPAPTGTAGDPFADPEARARIRALGYAGD